MFPMILQELALSSFRSYPKHSFAFSPDVTIILGHNTAGKTNILEAISLSATGKSFRAEKDTDMVFWGKEVARIRSQLVVRSSETDSENKKLEVVLTKGEVAGIKTPVKRYLVNEVPKRQVDFVGNLRVVLFWPEDLDLVTGSPSLRRKYLDFVLVQIDREYRRCLLSYEKGLRQRNKLLERIREGEATRNQLIFWDQLLIKDGNYLSAVRSDFINEINESSKPFGEFGLHYDASIISEARILQYETQEVAAAMTLVGPHRDDFQFLEKAKDLSAFGSRGEQRLAVLWLKLAELEFVAVRTKDRPILLLDDIFSELDHEHREEVVKVTAKQQTILTTTDKHFLPHQLLENAKMIELE